MKTRYHNNRLRGECDRYVCADCQRYKLDGKGYGLLPEREVTAEPFSDMAVDLIGPWKIPIGNKMVEFNALTCIDQAKNLVELIRIKNKTSRHIRHKFAQTWLARYPKPERCIHDNGGEFMGAKFVILFADAQIKDVSTSSKNPQTNAM